MVTVKYIQQNYKDWKLEVDGENYYFTKDDDYIHFYDNGTIEVGIGSKELLTEDGLEHELLDLLINLAK